jgi:hypothetical protein
MAFDKVIFDKVCVDLKESPLGLHHVCEKNNVKRTTFLEWVELSKENIDKYARAKDDQIEFVADEINRLTYEMQHLLREGVTYSEINVNAAVATLRVQVDALKWQLSKLAPKKYGDKIEVENTGTLTVKSVSFE